MVTLLPFPRLNSEETFLYAAKALTKGEQHLESSEEIDLHELAWDEVIDVGFQHGARLAHIAKYIAKQK